jgi:hypothetical protein
MMKVILAVFVIVLDIISNVLVNDLLIPYLLGYTMYDYIILQMNNSSKDLFWLFCGIFYFICSMCFHYMMLKLYEFLCNKVIRTK